MINSFFRQLFHRGRHDDARIKATALEWISRRGTETSPTLEAEFRSWLGADPRHHAAISVLQPGWARLSAPRRIGQEEDLRRRVQAAVSRRRRRIAAAASLAVAAVIAFAFVHLRPDVVSRERAPGIAVRPDRQTLADGSLVELNAGALVLAEYTAEVRRVRLVEGEALFHVMPDAARPFVVDARHVSVRAVGTAFTVRLDSGAVDVLVTHGKVAVELPPQEPVALPAGMKERTASAPILVAAGNRVMVRHADPVFESIEPRGVSVEEVATALAWRTRRVEVTETSLRDAIMLFNRDNALQLDVADADTGALRITGVFWTNDPEAFSRALELSLGLSAFRENDTRIVLRK